MRYIRFLGNTDYCGTSYEEIEAFPDGTSDDIIGEESMNIAQANAESYEYLGHFEDEEDCEAYYENALENAAWEEISEEEYKVYCG